MDELGLSESRDMEETSLRAFLQAFYHWYECAASPSQQCSRSRVLMVCLLIRFAALRLGEALALDDTADMDTEKGVLYVRGKWARVLPLPDAALKRLAELRDSPCNVRARGGLCHLDPAYVRRVFASRAREAGLPGVSPTDLRDFREQELLRQGIPLSVVEFFLGRGEGGAPKPEDEARLRKAFRRWEHVSRTGRHNVVSGALTLVHKGAFSCLLAIRTRGGMTFLVRCSTRTFTRLELVERQTTAVFVRSLQVCVLPVETMSDNCFPGKVTDVLEHDGEARVMVRLEDDVLDFCAILSFDSVQNMRLQKGGRVWILIRPEDFTFEGSAQGLH
ncbi:TOBE domain-containing protein [uncultured Mailhella sp.]|uniref:TOBE domain-containing protein n=1 Tax=uncultured Mailhella sp. TaxID=1981031 RepID=UPI0025D00630|nr:TOBE domain-containing protein [uncultured Mailhella sp.]